jgi:Mor family transcriptional regulator
MTTIPAELDHLITGTFRQLVDLIGIDAALALVEAHGGTRVYVRARPKPDKGLSRLIGQDAAAKLARAMGGGGIMMKIPMATAYRRELRNRAIVTKYAEGVPLTALAREFGMTESNIGRISRMAKLPRAGHPGA